ncbi:MAG: hypothetical protein ACREBH_03315 [Candidatus Micrarchaeaceae archaeon]
MLKSYGYLGLALIIFAEVNFYLVIEPFAKWYIPIVWYGYILFIDSIVYSIKKESLISSHKKEFLLMLLLSVPFWSIFEVYNLFTRSWIYINYIWYVHLIDFSTIMPAVLETFTLFKALDIGKQFDSNSRQVRRKGSTKGYVGLLVVVGALAALLPVLEPNIGYPFIWVGLFLLLDPLNYLIGRPSVIKKVSEGKRSMVIQLFAAGIVVGFFWEFWNYQAYPKWVYTLPYFISNLKLFAMPLFGYLGYLPFALEAFLFYAFFRSFLFKKGNDMLSI